MGGHGEDQYLVSPGVSFSKKKIAFLMQTWIDLSRQQVRYLGQDCLCQANPPSSYHMLV